MVLPRPTTPVPPPTSLTPNDLVLSLLSPLAFLVALLLPHLDHRVDPGPPARLPLLRLVPRRGGIALERPRTRGRGEGGARLGFGGGAGGRGRERVEAGVAPADEEDEVLRKERGP